MDRSGDDEGVSIGFPGGKVDPGEDPRVAALRETSEEGWQVSCSPDDLQEIYRDTVQGKLVVWYTPTGNVRCVPLKKYKEQHRIKAVPASPEQFKGFKNEDAISAYFG